MATLLAARLLAPPGLGPPRAAQANPREHVETLDETSLPAAAVTAACDRHDATMMTLARTLMLHT